MNLNLKLEEVREEVLNLLGAGVESEEQPQEKQGGGGTVLQELAYLMRAGELGKRRTPALRGGAGAQTVHV